mgnify:CR=1 FL=1
MTTYILVLLLSSLYIWGVFASDTYLTMNTTLERSPIIMASLLWPIAVAIAIVRIVMYAITKRNNHNEQ